ncbi:MAG: PQQ-binding-like beta-propeller repeat protein [Planctomycetaceae bacterium]|nr:PQQ-binding-like beta-propeller repeat protein [Planctomycetaceae bacterium]
MDHERNDDSRHAARGPEAGPAEAPAHDRGGTTWTGCLRRSGTLIWMLVVGGSLAGMVVLWVQRGEVDYATANVLTMILAFVVVIALVARMSLRRGAHRVTRWLSIGGVLLAILAASTLRIDRVSGRLVPRLTWRWSVKPDQLLDSPVIDAREPVDMRTTTPGDFPQFLGPRRNLVVTGVALARDWTTYRPRQLWRQPIGAGWSGFTAVNGFAVTMEQRGPEELVTCYEVTTGRLRWAHAWAARYETMSGGVGPRSTPTIADGLVYALGATGVLRCLDGATGALVWSDDILQRFDLTPEEDLQAVTWGRSASPLVVEDLVIVPHGGPRNGPWCSLCAYDKRTGAVRWTGGQWQVSYASPSLARLCGVLQVLSVNQAAVSGHRLEDGEVLWSYPWPGKSTADATVPQAVVVSDNRLLLSKGYGVRARLLELMLSAAGAWQVTEVWAKPVLKTKFTNVAIQDQFAYALSDGILECVEVDTGRRRWRDRRGNYGPGQILLVGDVILVQAESGEVVMVEANPDQLVELSRIPALTDQTWNNLCLYDHYLLVRNSVEAACYDLPLRTPPDAPEVPDAAR